MPGKKLKALPRFRTEAEERKFREAHDSAPYVDWSTAQPAAFPNLRPATKSMSTRAAPHPFPQRGKVARSDG